MKINVKINEKTFKVEVEDLNARPVIAVVDGEPIEVWPDISAAAPATSAAAPATPTYNPPARSAAQTAAKTQAAQDDSKVSAPIPGVIVEVNVAAGDAVKYGQELCVLEAMKMKNAIRAGRDGKIKAVHARIGEHVHQSQLLVEFEEKGQA